MSETIALYPIAKLFDPTKNSLPIDQILATSEDHVYFLCNRCGHNFHRRPKFLKNDDTNYCYHCPKKCEICTEKDCSKCLSNSFIDHEMAKYLHESEDPKKISMDSKKQYKFVCDKCNETYITTVNNIKHDDCAFMSVKTDDLDQSMVSTSLANCFSLKNPFPVYQTLKEDNRQFFYDCFYCKHTFVRTLNEINNYEFCPYCSRDLLCEDLACKPCFHRSLASSPNYELWNDEANAANDILARFVPRCSENHIETMMICNMCKQSFSTRVNSKTSKCKLCSAIRAGTRAELDAYYFIKQEFPDMEVLRNKRFPWYATSHGEIPFDLYIPDLLLIIEIDGSYHFNNIKHWHAYAKSTQKNDVKKLKLAYDNGFSTLRILSEHLYSDKGLEMIKSAIRLYESTKCIFVGQKYKEHHSPFVNVIFPDNPDIIWIE